MEKLTEHEQEVLTIAELIIKHIDEPLSWIEEVTER